jgi:hypothetical protein
VDSPVEPVHGPDGYSGDDPTEEEALEQVKGLMRESIRRFNDQRHEIDRKFMEAALADEPVAMEGLTSGEAAMSPCAGEPSDVAPPSEPYHGLLDHADYAETVPYRGQPREPLETTRIERVDPDVQVYVNGEPVELPVTVTKADRVQIVGGAGAPAASGDVSKPDGRSDTGSTESDPVRPVDPPQSDIVSQIEKFMSVDVPFGASFEEHAASVQEALAKRELKISLPKKTDEDLF